MEIREQLALERANNLESLAANYQRYCSTSVQIMEVVLSCCWWLSISSGEDEDLLPQFDLPGFNLVILATSSD